MRDSRLWLVILLVLTLGAVSAPVHAQSRASLGTIIVSVGGRAPNHYLPLMLAKQLGFFDAEAIDVDIRDFGGGAKAVEAMIGGSADITVNNNSYAYLLQPKGIDLVDLVLVSRLEGMVLLLAPDHAKAYRNPADLKGLTIGVADPGGAGEVMLQILLAKAGLASDDAHSVGVGSGPSSVSAVAAHRVDGIVQGDPAAATLETNGFALPVIDTRTLAGQTYVYGGPGNLGGISTTAAFAKAHPDKVQAFVNATVRVLIWMQTASTEQIIDTVPADVMGADPKLYARMLAENREAYTSDGRASVDEIKRTYDELVESGHLKPTDKVDLSRVFAADFVEHANRQYGH